MVALAATGATQLWANPGDVVFSETFDSEEALENWKIVDKNGGRTWEWLNGAAAYMLDYQTGLPGDDWLISPEFSLDQENVYTLEFSMNVLTRPESLRVLLGTGDDPSAFTAVLADYTNVTSDASGQKTVKVYVKASGKFRLAFYAYSEPNGHRVEVDNIKLTETSVKGVPAHVNVLTLTRGDKGAMTAGLSFTAPTVSAADAALTANMGIDIYRNDEAQPAKQFADVAPGASLSWTDNAPLHGNNIYKVVTRNSLGTGESSTVSDFIGLDAPKAVTGFTARLNAQRGATLAWTAPTESANGGYVDFANLRYIVKRDGTQLGEAVSATTFTDANPVEEGQKAVTYTVSAVAADIVGEAAQSGEVVTGSPLAAPYHESFAKQKMQTPWTLDPDHHAFSFELLPDDEDGEYEEIVSQDKDNGVLCFNSKTADYDSQSRLVSPLLSLTSQRSHRPPSPSGSIMPAAHGTIPTWTVLSTTTSRCSGLPMPANGRTLKVPSSASTITAWGGPSVRFTSRHRPRAASRASVCWPQPCRSRRPTATCMSTTSALTSQKTMWISPLRA